MKAGGGHPIESVLDGGRRVMVVEDDLEVGRFSTQVKLDLGYETTWTVNAEEAPDRLGRDGARFDASASSAEFPYRASLTGC